MKEKILVLEDEIGIRSFVSINLKREGYEIIEAGSGQEAIEQLSNHPDISIALLDVMLPDISGFELCKSMSKQSYVIMLTARDDVIDKILGMEIGADDYITKPFEIREVIARINAIFRRAEKNIINNVNENIDDNPKNDMDFTINFDKRVVVENGQEILLKRKEFELLSFLYKNKGIVFSRQELLNEVWGYDYYGDTRTVDVHIRRLRSHLGENKENSIIETVFGVGYVFK